MVTGNECASELQDSPEQKLSLGSHHGTSHEPVFWQEQHQQVRWPAPIQLFTLVMHPCIARSRGHTHNPTPAPFDPLVV